MAGNRVERHRSGAGVTEAGVALAAVRVEDPEGRSPARRAGPVAGDDHLRSLADDVAAEPDPRSTGELQPEAGRLAERAGDRRRQRPAARGRRAGIPARRASAARRPSRSRDARRRGPASPRASRRALDPLRQVDDEEVDRPTRRSEPAIARPSSGSPGVRTTSHSGGCRGPRPRPGRGAREVQPGDDRAGRLGLRREPQGERRLAARAVAAEREPGQRGTPPGPRIASSAAKPVRMTRSSSGDRRGAWSMSRGTVASAPRPSRAAESHSPDPWAAPPRVRRGRQGRRHVRGKGRHRTSNDRANVLFRQSPDGPRIQPGTATRTSPNAIAARPSHCTARSRSPRKPTATMTATAGPNELAARRSRPATPETTA